jgi:hypothetical protein
MMDTDLSGSRGQARHDNADLCRKQRIAFLFWMIDDG